LDKTGSVGVTQAAIAIDSIFCGRKKKRKIHRHKGEMFRKASLMKDSSSSSNRYSEWEKNRQRTYEAEIGD